MSRFPRNLHDAELVAVEMAEGRKVQLDVQASSGRARVLLHDVSIFRIVDLGVQNVIERAWLAGDSDLGDDGISDALTWATSTTDSRSYLSDVRTRELLRSIRQGRQYLFGIVPSVGAELVALCGWIEVVAPEPQAP